MPILIGSALPDVPLARMVDGEIVAINAARIFSNKSSLIIGVPGAFTPVCTREHVPDLVRNARKLKAAGYEQIACIVANDPFVVEAWSQMLDPGREILFLADGNLQFTSALGLVSYETGLHLGQRSCRYIMRVDSGIIRYLRVEPSILVYACTNPDAELAACISLDV